MHQVLGMLKHLGNRFLLVHLDTNSLIAVACT